MYYDRIDESKLNWKERLCLAYCRLCHGDWDTIFGEKPAGFDELPDYTPERRFRKHQPCKWDYLKAPLQVLKREIGEAELSRFVLITVEGKTEEEWLDWFIKRELSILRDEM